MNKKAVKKFIVVQTTVFLLCLVYFFGFLPSLQKELLELPEDYSYSASLVSYDNLFDEVKGVYAGEIRSQAKFSYTAVATKDDVVEVKNGFDVRTIDDDPIFSVSRLYGIEHDTYQHKNGYGDKDRTGFLFAPGDYSKEDFTYWHVNYDQPLTMKYQAEEFVLGLKTYRYRSTFTADQTKNLTNLPNVGETRGIAVDVVLDTWIEPFTGILVKYEDNATAHYYNLATMQRQNPWNQFRNSYNFNSIANHVELAREGYQKKIVVSSVLPTVLIAVIVLLGGLLLSFCGKYYNWNVSSLILLCIGIAGSLIGIIEISLLVDNAFLQNIFKDVNNQLIVIPFILLIAMTCYVLRRRSVTTVDRAIFALLLLAASMLLIVGDLHVLAPAALVGFMLLFIAFYLGLFLKKNKVATIARTLAAWLVVLISLLFVFSFAYGVYDTEIRSWYGWFSLSTATLFLIMSSVSLLIPVNAIKGRHVIANPVFLAPILFLVSVFLLGFLWQATRDSSIQNKNLQFEIEVNKVDEQIRKQINNDVNALIGARSLFDASQEVERSEWKAYTDGLQINKNYAGIQGIGYAKILTKGEKHRVEDQVRKDGYPDFKIYPVQPEREMYTTILYLEPFDERNQRAFGFDMFSEPTRRAAMELARDTGEPALSGKVRLLQETDVDVQAGSLLYLAVYKKNSVLSTVEDRRKNIIGYVYSPIRVGNFIKVAIPDQSTSINLEIFDAKSIEDSNEKNRMYGEHREDVREFVKVNLASIGGHDWVMRYSGSPLYNATNSDDLPFFVLVGGILASVLFGAIVFNLASSRKRAYNLAHKITKDLQQERNAALRLRKKDDAILRGIGDGLIVFGINGKVESMNLAALKMFNCQEDDVLGKPYHETLIAANRDEIIMDKAKRPATRVLETGKTVSEVIWYKRKSGGFFPARINVSPIQHNGRMVGAIEIFRDITSEEELILAKDDFIAMASHQLSTPATAVKGYLSLILEGYADKKEEMLKMVNKAYLGNERQISIIQNLLNTARIESGRAEIHKDSVVLVDLVQSIVDEHLPLIQQRSQTVKVAIPRSVHLVSDSGLLALVIDNLVSNASKYTKSGGSIFVSAAQNEKVVELRVEDSGVGIDSKDTDKLFTRFSRISNELSTKVSGTGLGLYIANKVVKKLGGSIDVKSIHGKGTVFIVQLRKGESHDKNTGN